MPKFRVHNFAISLDGYVSSPSVAHTRLSRVKAAAERPGSACG